MLARAADTRGRCERMRSDAKNELSSVSEKQVPRSVSPNNSVPLEQATSNQRLTNTSEL